MAWDGSSIGRSALGSLLVYFRFFRATLLYNACKKKENASLGAHTSPPSLI